MKLKKQLSAVRCEVQCDSKEEFDTAIKLGQIEQGSKIWIICDSDANSLALTVNLTVTESFHFNLIRPV